MSDKPSKLKIADREFTSRLLVGTGKFASNELMRDALVASGTEIVTVALRRAALALGPNINLPTDPDREKMAWDLVAKARAANPQGAEKDYVEAVARRYTNPPGPDRTCTRWAAAGARSP